MKGTRTTQSPIAEVAHRLGRGLEQGGHRGFGRDGERGTALIWALMFVVVTSGMIVAHTTFMTASRREQSVVQRERSLSRTFARSGLTDALAWFQRQPVQPVASFAPKYEPNGNPPSYDTEDAATGLVRMFRVRGSLWGRYEVRTGEAMDISQERGMGQAGSVWELCSHGTLFWRVDPARPPGEGPNRVVATQVATTEIRGITAELPADAALSVDDLGGFTLETGGYVDGAGTLAIAAKTDSVSSAMPPDVVGSPPTAEIVGYDASEERVFGMPLEQLTNYADLVVESKYAGAAAGTYFDTTSLLPKKLPKSGVVVIRGNTYIPNNGKLNGSGFFVFDGKVRFEAGNKSDLKGLVYFADDVEIRGKFKMMGGVIARGQVLLGGTGPGKKAEIIYSQKEIEKVRKDVARYRAERTQR